MCPRRSAAAFAAAALLAAAPRTGRAQSPQRDAATNAGWIIGRDAFAELWFHCLAVVGYRGDGEYPFYDPRYAIRVRGAKAGAGIETPLELSAGTFRRAFERDSAFEVLHFVPLYFVGRAPEAAVAELASGSSAAARAVRAALPTDAERALFRRFLDAARDEWRLYLSAQLGELTDVSAASLAGLAAAWRDTILPAIAARLPAGERAHGIVLVVPALGREGRVVRDVAGGPIVAVGEYGLAADRSAPLFATVRELAFALVPPIEPADPTQRVAAERARDAAATRSGAALLEAVAPRLAARYRLVFPTTDGMQVRSFNNK
ncbi:MAG TPA: hypothetical protein VHB25_19535 [Gemmatimonadaceae bacterium]|nr:hypothetical protein [Gemmatimonadaceae bacterium]